MVGEGGTRRSYGESGAGEARRKFRDPRMRYWVIERVAQLASKLAPKTEGRNYGRFESHLNEMGILSGVA